MEKEELQESENLYYYDYDEELRDWERYCDQVDYQLWGL